MGTYVLALWLRSATWLTVGRLGVFCLPAGWYLYAGSARAPGGLAARLARHWRLACAGKKLHWHIDHLRQVASWGGAWSTARDERLECRWASRLRGLPGAQVVAPGFGASDCRCPAHLVHVACLPGEDWFRTALNAERIVVDKRELAELLQVLLTSDDESREVAARALARFGPRAAGHLVPLLSNEDQDARWWVTRALAEVGGHDAVAALRHVLDDPDPDLRACAALALGRIRDASAAPALASRLSDESAFVASIAADALSLIGEPAVDTLAEILTAKEPHARLLAVRALSRVKSQKAIGPLFGLLEDPSYLVRYYAHEALEALGVGMILLAP